MKAPLYPSLPKVGTNYCVADPGGNKNWFLKWYRMGAEPDWLYLYREWPPKSTCGQWAEMRPEIGSEDSKRRFDGYRGPAQRHEFNPAILRYKQIILEAEGHVWDEAAGRWDGAQAEEIFCRYIDPRMGGVEVPSAEDGTSIIALMEDEQVDALGRIVGPSMIWTPAPGGGGAIHTLAGQEMFNSWLHFDPTKPVDVTNCPRFYVVEACEQSILAYKEYTGVDGEKGMLKDVVDPDLYLIRAEPEHIHDGALVCAGPGDEG